MIRIEQNGVRELERAMSNMKAKGYRMTESGNYEAYVSEKAKSISLGTYKNEDEAKSAVLKYRIARFVERVRKDGDDPSEGKVFENDYVAFPSGNIYNLYGHKMIGATHRCGYRCAIIHGKSTYLHRITATLFVGNPDNLEQVNHKNGIKDDNRADNLEWCTRSENLLHAYRTGLEKRRLGESNHLSKLTNEKVRFIRENYKRRDKDFGTTGLAKMFGVSQATISKIVLGEAWRDVV